MKENKIPKILIISNNCFSKEGSNGRTLGNYFKDWPQEKIAQFYLKEELPNLKVCDNYFRITDIEILKSFFSLKNIGAKIKLEDYQINKEKTKRKKKKIFKNIKLNKIKFFRYFIRNIIWNINFFKNENFKKWLDEFKPEKVLIQLGDSEFIIRIALKIAKERNIPIIIYSTEDYYFKDNKFFSFFSSRYRKAIKELYLYSSGSIYNTKMLRESYRKKFKDNSIVIMPIKEKNKDSNFKKIKKLTANKKIVYLGNLGLNRHKSLIEIGEALQRINNNFFLEVYGKISSDNVEKELTKCQGIKYKGFVSYEKVEKIILNSDLLIHAESFSEFYKKDLKHAFSTKITDCLASGTSFLLYAPKNLACTEYLLKEEAACVVNKKDELEKSLKNILFNEKLQQKYISKALKLVKKNHDLEKNSKLFRDFICEI